MPYKEILSALIIASKTKATKRRRDKTKKNSLCQQELRLGAAGGLGRGKAWLCVGDGGVGVPSLSLVGLRLAPGHPLQLLPGRKCQKPDTFHCYRLFTSSRWGMQDNSTASDNPNVAATSVTHNLSTAQTSNESFPFLRLPAFSACISWILVCLFVSLLNI